MNPLKTIYYHFSLLQLENYNLTRYGHGLLKHYLPARELRHTIIWTAKLKTVAALAATLFIIISVIVQWLTQSALISLITALMGILLFPLYISASVILLSPFDYLIKKIIIARAKKKLRLVTINALPSRLTPQPFIIAIAGSYGKTTMKEMVAAALEGHYAVLKTPDNINTPLGIARLILKKLNPETQIVIVEMGAYHASDIKTLCELMPPDIAIMTGINEAHLERFGSIENTIAAKFEIVDYAKKDALIILNEDNELIMQNHTEHTSHHTTMAYSAHKGYALPPLQLLGDYARGAARGALMVAEILNVPPEQSAHALTALKPLPHRLQPILTPNHILIIDDSYNGNIDGAREAMRVLARYANRRKIYITPGLVETGKQNKIIHETLGQELAQVADLVILIKNSATVHLHNGLLAAAFPREHIREFMNAREAHRALPSILQSGDVVLFQNDWPDNYF